MNQELKHLFTPGPMVSFRSSRKISSYLVRAKLYPVERSVGPFNCKRIRCQICTYVTETDSFTSKTETYKTNHKFDCMEKCLIYLFTCNKCRKQYAGQTVDTFRYRWNNYRLLITLVNMRMAYHACKNICTNIFVIVNIVVLLMTSQ